MNNIKLLSRTLVFCFGIYLVWIAYSFFYSWIVLKYPVNSPLEFHFGNTGNFYQQHSELPNFYTMDAPFIWKIAYFLETTLLFGLYVFFSVKAIRLFWMYNKGTLFDLTCVKLIRSIGCLVFAICIFHLVCPPINTYLLSNQLGLVFQALSFEINDAMSLITALVLIVTSLVMEESYKIYDEQQHTV